MGWRSLFSASFWKCLPKLCILHHFIDIPKGRDAIVLYSHTSLVMVKWKSRSRSMASQCLGLSGGCKENSQITKKNIKLHVHRFWAETRVKSNRDKKELLKMSLWGSAQSEPCAQICAIKGICLTKIIPACAVLQLFLPVQFQWQPCTARNQVTASN